MTFGNLFATYFSVSDICCVANPQDFPGKRQGGLDFSYRLPHVRKWLTIYTDNFSEDDVNPLVNPSRAMYNPGIYLSQIPRLRKFDFRFEFANTHHHEEAYTSFFYKDAYMNKGFLLGDTVGRRHARFNDRIWTNGRPHSLTTHELDLTKWALAYMKKWHERIRKLNPRR